MTTREGMHPDLDIGFAPGAMVADHLRLERRLAAGGMGSVWIAHDLARGQEVAVKFVLRTHDPVVRERLVREARMAASLDHPHAVRILDQDLTPEGVPYIVMELLDGESLGARLHRSGPLQREEAVALIRQVASALEAAHTQGIVHRDVKPDNIIVLAGTGPLSAKLVDFGIAKPVGAATTLTQAGQIIGTPMYIAPEQLLDERPVDRHADLWALALVAYEALVARRTFGGESLATTAMRIMLRRYDAVTAIDAGLPSALDGFFERALHADVRARFPSAGELAAAFERASAGTGDGPAPRLPAIRFPERLYGRDAELAVLQHAYEAAIRGSSRVVLVGGYAGTGKTSLVRELTRRVRPLGAMTAHGKFDAYDRGTPYKGIIDALRALIRSSLALPAHSVAGLQSRLQEAIGDGGQVLVEVIEELTDLLGPQPELASLSPQDRRARFQVAIGRLVHALASHKHPLVLFLDDLQWADLESLELIASLATHPQSHHVLLIGAYRDNEVGAAHPLTGTVERMRAEGRLDEIALGALSEDAVLELVGDTFPGLTGRVRLAAACHAKTRGNAFFLRRFLESLVEGEHLRFDGGLERWSGDVAAIGALRMPDDVADFIAAGIDRFEPPSREALAMAACIAHRFELATLAHALDVEPTEALRRLRPGLESELIAPERNPDRPDLVVFGFTHDRFRQAAHARLDDATAGEVHRRVGWYLLGHLDAAALERRLSEVVDHLNRGLAGPLSRGQRARLRGLNLDAARRAIRSAAFEVGDRYLQQAHALCEADAWAADNAQTLAIVVEGARAAWLVGAHDRTEALVGEALANAREPLDRVAAREVRIQAHLSQQRFREALDLTLATLTELGLELPASPGEAEVATAVGQTMAALQACGADQVERLPMCGEPVVQAQLRIQTGAMSSAYFAAPNLLPILASNIVGATLEHGVCNESAYGFAALGMVLNAVNQIEASYEVGKLAQDMLERVGERSIVPRTLHVLSAHVLLFVDPLRDEVALEEQVARLGFDTGDLEYAAWGLHCQVCNGFYAGLPLDALAETATRNVQTLRHHQQMAALGCTLQYQHAIDVLRGLPPVVPSLNRPDYDEAAEAAAFREIDFRGAAFVLAVIAGWIRYLFGDLRGALTLFDEGGPFADGAVATYHQVWWHQFRALTVLALAERGAGEAAEEAIAAHRSQLQVWADQGPVNHRHRLLLVDGELARVQGRLDDALALFAEAAQAAAASRFTHEEALAHELTAHALDRAGRDASAAWTSTREAYRRWGAVAKVAALPTMPL